MAVVVALLSCRMFVVSSVTLLFIALRFLSRSRQNLPPSPFRLPIIGHLYLLRGDGPLYRKLTDLASRFGPLMHLRLGVRSVVVVASPFLVEECFTKNDITFANRPQSIAADILTYNYTAFVFAPYGHLWRVLRRVAVVEMLSSASVHNSAAIREEEAYELVRQVFRVSKDGRRKVDTRVLFSLLAFNVIFRILSGKRCYEAEGDAWMEEGKQRLEKFKNNFVAGAVRLNACDFFPILRWFGHKGSDKSVVELYRRRDEFLENMILEVRQKDGSNNNTRTEHQGERKTLIGALLSLQKSDPDFYSDRVIKSMVMVMLVAGTDTSSITLEWAMSLLLNHPKELQKLIEEIDGQVGSSRLLRELDLNNLPYLRAVVYETLRLYPSVPLLVPHFSSEKCTVGGFEIPENTTLLVNAWAVHRDPTAWEQPAEFKPERFEGVEGERDGTRFIPFGMGRRACPGAAMGLRMMSLALGVMVQCFEWESVGGERVDMTPSSGQTITKAEPLMAMCGPRQNMRDLLLHL